LYVPDLSNPVLFLLSLRADSFNCVANRDTKLILRLTYV
jgi:hypothetical protein